MQISIYLLTLAFYCLGGAAAPSPFFHERDIYKCRAQIKIFFEKTSSNSQFRNQNLWYLTTLLLSPRGRSNFSSGRFGHIEKAKILLCSAARLETILVRKNRVFSKISLCLKSREKNLSNEPHQSITRQKLAILKRNKFL